MSTQQRTTQKRGIIREERQAKRTKKDPESLQDTSKASEIPKVFIDAGASKFAVTILTGAKERQAESKFALKSSWSYEIVQDEDTEECSFHVCFMGNNLVSEDMLLDQLKHKMNLSLIDQDTKDMLIKFTGKDKVVHNKMITNQELLWHVHHVAVATMLRDDQFPSWIREDMVAFDLFIGKPDNYNMISNELYRQLWKNSFKFSNCSLAPKRTLNYVFPVVLEGNSFVLDKIYHEKLDQILKESWNQKVEVLSEGTCSLFGSNLTLKDGKNVAVCVDAGSTTVNVIACEINVNGNTLDVYSREKGFVKGGSDFDKVIHEVLMEDLPCRSSVVSDINKSNQKRKYQSILELDVIQDMTSKWSEEIHKMMNNSANIKEIVMNKKQEYEHMFDLSSQEAKIWKLYLKWFIKGSGGRNWTLRETKNKNREISCVVIKVNYPMIRDGVEKLADQMYKFVHDSVKEMMSEIKWDQSLPIQVSMSGRSNLNATLKKSLQDAVTKGIVSKWGKLLEKHIVHIEELPETCEKSKVIHGMVKMTGWNKDFNKNIVLHSSNQYPIFTAYSTYNTGESGSQVHFLQVLPKFSSSNAPGIPLRRLDFHARSSHSIEKGYPLFQVCPTSDGDDDDEQVLDMTLETFQVNSNTQSYLIQCIGWILCKSNYQDLVIMLSKPDLSHMISDQENYEIQEALRELRSARKYDSNVIIDYHDHGLNGKVKMVTGNEHLDSFNIGKIELNWKGDGNPYEQDCKKHAPIRIKDLDFQNFFGLTQKDIKTMLKQK